MSDPSLQELILAIEEERRAKIQWARNAYSARAREDRLAAALRLIDEAIPRVAKLPLVVEVKEIAQAALAAYDASKGGAQ